MSKPPRASRSEARRITREDIVDLFRACAAKNDGKTPGKLLFEKLTGVTEKDVNRHFWRLGYTELAQEAGLPPNTFQPRLEDDEVFEDYAKICLHVGQIPNHRQLAGAQRDLETRTHSVPNRFEGGITEFQQRFRQWLQKGSPHLLAILDFEGWRAPPPPSNQVNAESTIAARVEPHLHPFLPALLQYLDVLARGERPPFDYSEQPISTIFERRTADAFRCLGFEISALGQGTGRNADALALAPREHFAVIIDAKVRSLGYVMGTEDRKFLEYSRSHGVQLQRQGFDRIYFVVVGSSFKQGDLKKLTETLSASPIRNVILLEAAELMRWVEQSIRDRSGFSLSALEQKFFTLNRPA